MYDEIPDGFEKDMVKTPPLMLGNGRILLTQAHHYLFVVVKIFTRSIFSKTLTTSTKLLVHHGILQLPKCHPPRIIIIPSHSMRLL